MSAARDEILASIRRSLGVNGREQPRRMLVADRLARRPPGPVPLRGQGSRAQRVATFIAEAERAHTSVAVVHSEGDIPLEIARFLRENNLPATLRMGADPQLARLPWDATSLALSFGPSGGDDLNSVSYAVAAVAETGTLVLASGADNPTTLNFLADNHIVVLRAETLQDSLESVWRFLRGQDSECAMPRALNLITGPSRSADIEQTMLLGAHGPRRLHAILLDKR